MSLGAVLDFYISIFEKIFIWFYNLQLPISDTVSIPLGSFLLAFVVLAICVKVFGMFNAFGITHDSEGHIESENVNNYYSSYYQKGGR